MRIVACKYSFTTRNTHLLGRAGLYLPKWLQLVRNCQAIPRVQPLLHIFLEYIQNTTKASGGIICDLQYDICSMKVLYPNLINWAGKYGSVFRMDTNKYFRCKRKNSLQSLSVSMTHIFPLYVQYNIWQSLCCSWVSIRLRCNLGSAGGEELFECKTKRGHSPAVDDWVDTTVDEDKEG